MKRRALGISLALALPLGCAHEQAAPPSVTTTVPSVAATAPSAPSVATTAPSTAAVVLRLLAGRFDSAAQAGRDPAFHDVHLDACVVAAPALGERALYLEQALADALDHPYRQRLYVVDDAGPGRARTRIFELKEAARWVGSCARATTTPPAIGAADVVERAGCGVTLEQEGDAFVGRTADKSCPSSLRGASWATSEVHLVDGELRSWDRGYAADGKQVWGAEKGPYEFIRRSAAHD